MPFHFRHGGRERVALGQGGGGRGQGVSPGRPTAHGRLALRAPMAICDLRSMSSYDMVRGARCNGVTGLPGTCVYISLLLMSCTVRGGAA
ncbi:hypothetical protein BURMUCGD1_1039 [Burkholderia multivorans CGD1]|nr:hypothetical protein BURMUCGD1_1039 [Burkholderia multivorans CGD1]